MKIKIYLIFTFILFVYLKDSTAQMFWQQACTFLGTNSSYIAVPSSSSLDIYDNFTLEAWVNPANSTSPTLQIILQKKEGNNYNGYTLYLNNGKVAIRTNLTTRLIGKNVIPSNTWTHIAGTYNSSTNLFRVYINGAVDTSATVLSASPFGSTDSLFIGKGSNSPFAGKLDEIRIWNRELISLEVNPFRRLSLGTSSGVYSGLVMSMTFQNANSSGSKFTLADWSGNNNNGLSRGVFASDETNEPSGRIALNECLEIKGLTNFVKGNDSPNINPTTSITLECWVYQRSGTIALLIYKGPDIAANFANYGLEILGSFVHAFVNGHNFQPPGNLIPYNEWTHIAFTYSAITGNFGFYINGNTVSSGHDPIGNIPNDPTSLYIGGKPADAFSSTYSLDGYIDEVRIISKDLSGSEIRNTMYESYDESNDPEYTNVTYNFDGYMVSNTDPGPTLQFQGNMAFSNNTFLGSVPLSPINRENDLNFPESFYLKTSNKRIPASGTSGNMNTDTLNITLNETINDINVFVALNHTNEGNLTMTLVNPNNFQVIVYSNNILAGSGDHVNTIFDDQADSSLFDSRYFSFGPTVKSFHLLNSIFSGGNTNGAWKLKISDNASGDTGKLYAWGIQFNNLLKKKSVLSLTALLQGFYNPSSNSLIPDTMRIYLRNNTAPFSVIDSSKAILGVAGTCICDFKNIIDTVDFYIQLKHRNSIETWSNSGLLRFDSTNHLSYDFTASQTKAFGNNMIQVDSLPVKFAIYSGDVNQDGTIDLSDIILIYNDANNFVSGYVKTDLNGDNFIDLSDLILAYNNSNNFISKITP